MSAQAPHERMIATALQASTQVHETLLAIDLRTTRGAVRAALREARAHSASQCLQLQSALRLVADGKTGTPPRRQVADGST